MKHNVRTMFLFVYSDDSNTANPMVANDQDDLDDSFGSRIVSIHSNPTRNSIEDLNMTIETNLTLSTDETLKRDTDRELTALHHQSVMLMPSLDNDFPLWAGDSSARRSPEGKVLYTTTVATVR